MSSKSRPATTSDRKKSGKRRRTTTASQEQEELSVEQCRKLREAFEAHDKEHQESLSIRQVKRAVKSLGIKVSSEEISAWLSQITTSDNDDNDDDSSTRMNFEIFSTFAKPIVLRHDRSMRAFDLLDGNNKGFVALPDLQRAARELDLFRDEGDGLLEDLLEFADPDDKGFLSREDIARIAKKVNL